VDHLPADQGRPDSARADRAPVASSEAIAIEAINLGVKGYLTKPFGVEKVLAVASRALGGTVPVGA